jgi:integrase
MKEWINLYGYSLPEWHVQAFSVPHGPLRSTPREQVMKNSSIAHATARSTLQSVLDRLAADGALAPSRKRDLRSAVATFAKLTEKSPSEIVLDVGTIRKTLDGMVPAQARVSPKRWLNLRSDLAAAIDASGLRPMLRTGGLRLAEAWVRLLAPADRGVRNGLSRFARWASLRRIRPGEVDDRTIELFIAELDGAALVRNLRKVRRTVARCWNSLARRQQTAGLRPVTVPTSWTASTGIPWRQLPAAFREDVEEYLVWAAVPDPLAEGAREKALAPSTLRLRRTQIQVAARAAVAAGIPVGQFTSLASLVEPDTFRAILRHRWQHDGRTLSFFTNGLAEALIEIGAKWAKASPDVLSELKALRRRLGTLPAGLTEKNQGLLRKFDDPRLVPALVQLPDRLWRAARRGLATERRPFIALQSALAIDLLLYAPLRMQNLASLSFDQHLHWPQGRRKPAMVTFRVDETKNGAPLELEIPPVLAERLQVYRNEIAPAVIGRRPNAVFVSLTGTPRSQTAIKLAIQTTVLRHLGVKITPHQFRHLAAKIALDANPSAYELVRQLLGHKNLNTTTKFYAGVDTRRAGRAHAALIMRLRESRIGRGRSPRAPGARED